MTKSLSLSLFRFAKLAIYVRINKRLACTLNMD